MDNVPAKTLEQIIESLISIYIRMMIHGASAQEHAGTLLSLSAIIVVAVVHLIDAINC